MNSSLSSAGASPSPPIQPNRKHRLAKVAAWTGGTLAALLLIIGVTLTVLLHSQRFHDYLIDKVEAEASDSLGVRVQLQNFTLHLSTLSLDLWGITIDGASPYANPPLMQVDHAQVGVRIVSILQKKWYLDNFLVDRPVVRIYVDKNGISNIPKIKSSRSSSNNTTVFDLGIRRAILDRGQFYYNDKQSVLNADLRDLDFRATFDSSQQKYSGSISYSDGHLVSGTFKPIPHSLEAHFDATPNMLTVSEAKLTSGPSQVTLEASLQNYSNPIVQGHYDALVDGHQIQHILDSPYVPVGLVRATGSIQYQQVPNRSPLDTLLVNGDISSQQLDVKSSSVRTQIRNIAGHYSMRNGDAILQDFKADLIGGVLTASGKMGQIGGNSHSDFIAAINGVSLVDLRRLAGPSDSTKNVGLTGKLDAKVNATWGKTFNDLVAKADVSIAGNVSGWSGGSRGLTASSQIVAVGGVIDHGGHESSQTIIPINSAIHGTYTNSNEQLAFKDSYLRTPATNLTLNGLVSTHSKLEIRLQADDLREVETIATVFRTAPAGHSLQPLGLSGTASFQGSVEGSTSAPHLNGKMIASNFHVNGTDWKVLRSDIDLSPIRASLQNVDLEPMARGKIAFNATVGLDKWSFTNSSPVQVELNATQINVADLATLAGQQMAVTGTLDASIKIHGTELSPLGKGVITLTNVNAYRQPVKSVQLTFVGNGDEANGDIAIALPTGAVQSTFSVRPKQNTYQAKLTATDIHLDKLQALQANNIIASGVLSINASGQGSFDDPRVDATIQIPQLILQKQAMTGLNLHLNVANHVGIASLTTMAHDTSIRANAKVSLTGNYFADVTLDTQSIPLQPILAIYAPDQATKISGQTEIHATLHGPLKDPKQLEAHLAIPVLKLGYTNAVQLAATSPIKVDYENGVVTLQRSSIKGTDTNLELEGSVPTTGNGPMRLLLQGNVDLKLAQLFEPDIQTSGQIRFNIDSKGAANASDVGGEIDIVDANYASGDLPVGLSHANGVLTLTRSRLNISNFEGTVGGGTLKAQGAVAYSPKVQFDLGLAAQGIRVLYPQGVRESIDANLRLAGSTENALLGGSVNISDLSFTPAFDLGTFISQFSGGAVTPPSQGVAQNIHLNLAVRSTNDVNLVSRTLSVGGSANLQVRGTAADPVILGRVNLTDGDIILNGSRFVLNGGTVQFVNPSETEPVVNVTLNTSIQQYNIYLRFNGPVSQLRTDYSSDPALPAADIINLLAFGKTTEASAQSTTTTNQEAESLVASQVSSQVTSRISKIAGISQLSISPVLGGSSNQGNPGANITIQQRVTGNLFVTFSSNVGSTQSQTIQGQYQISPKVAISATRDQNGGFAFDGLIKKSW